PPRSTLFPYTTLFRSDLDGHVSACTVYVSVASRPAGTGTRNRTSVADSFSDGTLLSTTRHTPKRASRTSTVTGPGLAFVMVTRKDRKSTRLNSSHGSI